MLLVDAVCSFCHFIDFVGDGIEFCSFVGNACCLVQMLGLYKFGMLGYGIESSSSTLNLDKLLRMSLFYSF